MGPPEPFSGDLLQKGLDQYFYNSILIVYTR